VVDLVDILGTLNVAVSGEIFVVAAIHAVGEIVARNASVT
jgi:hypothetical protein